MENTSSPGSLRSAFARSMQASRPNAQLFGIVGAGIIAVFSGGWYISNVITRLQTELADQNRIFQAEIARAKAEAIQETNDKFMTYGYAEEYKRFQERALGIKPKKDD